MYNKIKRMSAKEFTDSGLLFAVNHKVLHPLGLALEVAINEEGEYRFGGVKDYRDDPEGMLYHESTLQNGAAKLKQYMDERGDKDIEDRVAALGYTIQPLLDKS